MTTNLPEKISSFNDVDLLRLVRDVAMDIQPLEKILVAHKLDATAWSTLCETTQFKEYMNRAVQEWQSASNTADRVRLKSLAFIEEALPEFYTRAHDPKEPLTAKIEIIKTISKLAGIGGNVDGAIQGERLVVTINLGADRELKIEKDITPQVIDGVAA
jgi:hypothetical protein